MVLGIPCVTDTSTSLAYDITSDTSINGVTYTTDTVLYDTLQNQVGCDSIVEITLTFDPQSVDNLLGGKV